MSTQFEDILYEIKNGVAWITINRPDKMNAFRGTTCDEIIRAMNKAGYDRSVGCIVLAGAGDKAFCTGGDQSAHDGNYDGRGTIGLPMEELHTAIRDVPKPVIARVQGYAIGGGNVLATICDLTIVSEKAIMGQVGPKMGSVDPGYGTAFLAGWAKRQNAPTSPPQRQQHQGGVDVVAVYAQRELRPAGGQPQHRQKHKPARGVGAKKRLHGGQQHQAGRGVQKLAAHKEVHMQLV